MSTELGVRRYEHPGGLPPEPPLPPKAPLLGVNDVEGLRSLRNYAANGGSQITWLMRELRRQSPRIDKATMERAALDGAYAAGYEAAVAKMAELFGVT